jgi:hypothetical protein
MRRVTPTLLLAALLVIAGCSLFRDPRVQVAEITSITAPDTVRAGAIFNITAHVVLGMHGLYSLDHTDITSSGSCFTVQVWSRDNSKAGYTVPWIVTERDMTFEAGPAEPGEFRIVAYQPDRRITEKIITVLP